MGRDSLPAGRSRWQSLPQLPSQFASAVSFCWHAPAMMRWISGAFRSAALASWRQG